MMKASALALWRINHKTTSCTKKKPIRIKYILKLQYSVLYKIEVT